MCRHYSTLRVTREQQMYHGRAGRRGERFVVFRPNLVSTDETRKPGCLVARTAGRIIKDTGVGPRAAAAAPGVRPLTFFRGPEAGSGPSERGRALAHPRHFAAARRGSLQGTSRADVARPLARRSDCRVR